MYNINMLNANSSGKLQHRIPKLKNTSHQNDRSRKSTRHNNSDEEPSLENKPDSLQNNFLEQLVQQNISVEIAKVCPESKPIFHYGHIQIETFKEFFDNYYHEIMTILVNENFITPNLEILTIFNPTLFTHTLYAHFPFDSSKKLNIHPPYLHLSTSKSADYRLFLEQISFEICSFLIKGLPQVSHLGSINLYKLKQDYPGNFDRLLTKLNQYNITTTNGLLIMAPSYNEICNIFNTPTSSKLSKNIFDSIKSGLGHF